MPQPPEHDRQRTVIALAIGLIAIIGVAISMTLPLLSLRLDEAGWSGIMIGLNSGAMALATLIVGPLIPKLARLLGIRTLLVIALLAGAVAILGFGWAQSLWSWFGLRIVLGAAVAALFILSEFWINAAAPDDRRGFVMGIYGTVLALGFASGPLVLHHVGTSGEWPLIIGAGLFCCALLPVWLAGGQTPQMEGHDSLGFVFLLKSSPVAAMTALLFGAIETGAFSVLPVYGLRIGLDVQASAAQITAVALGNLLFQIPFGWLADRVDKIRLLQTIAVLAGLALLLIPVIDPFSWVYLAVLCLWGGIAASLYGVGLALLGTQFHGAMLVSANALFVMLYAGGQMLGPPFLGMMMDLAPPHGYIWASCGLFALYVGLSWQFRRSASR